MGKQTHQKFVFVSGLFFSEVELASVQLFRDADRSRSSDRIV